MLRRMLMALGVLFLAACTQSLATDTRDPLEMVSSAPDPAGSQSREMLGRLVGQWVLTGVIAHQSTVHDVEAEWVLQHNYVRITETSRERGDNGQPVYEATIFVGWVESAHHYVCIWLDNTEVASGEVTCSAPNTQDAIPWEFRDGHGALIFTNTFTYRRADDSWQWRLVNPDDRDADPFGMVTLRRR